MARRSYGQVRDFVLDRAGATTDVELIQLTMQDVLVDFWNRMEELAGLTTASLSVSSGLSSYVVPTVVQRVGGVYNVSTPLPNRRPATTSEANADTTTQTIMSWYVDDLGVLVLWPPPTEAATLTLRGSTALDTTLYDEPDGLLTWRWVALPDDLHLPFQNKVLGRVLGDNDPQAAQYWDAVAESVFGAWRRRQRQALVLDPFVMNQPTTPSAAQRQLVGALENAVTVYVASSGASGRSYVFVQTELLDVWIINHNLGAIPVGVVAMDENGYEVQPTNTLHVSENQTILTFGAPLRGSARLLA